MIELLDYVSYYVICMLTWLDLVLLVLWCTFFGPNECVLLIGIVLSNVHKTFQSKMHNLMKCPFLACFHDMYAYGPILTTNAILTLFFPFPQHFRFRSLKGFWRQLRRRLVILNHPSCVRPHFPRAISLSSLWCCFSF